MERLPSQDEPHLDASLVGLLVGRSIVSAAFSFVTLASPEMLLEINKGNLVKAEKVRALVETTTTLAGFLIRPMIGTCTDSFGRTPGLILGPLLSACARSAVAVRPTNSMYVIYRVTNLVALIPVMQSFTAVLADRLGGRGSKEFLRFSKWTEVWLAVVRLMSIRIASRFRNKTVSFLIASGLSILASGVFFASVNESLPKDERKPFAWKAAANPFTFIEFFNRNKKLRTLALLTVLLSIPEYNGTAQFYRRHKFGWKWAENAKLEQVSNMVEILSPFWCLPLMGRLGEKSSLVWSQILKSISNVNLACTRDDKTIYLNPLVQSFCDGSSLGILQHHAASSLGSGEGELSSSLMNLRFPLGLLLPSWFSSLFEKSLIVRNPQFQGSAPFLLVASCHLLNATLVIPWAWDTIMSPSYL